ncbi:MAG TPA: sugar phosphate nucleotidyltransferase [Solirubrobacter sp.]|nr:sugar phosphate nucleotidyltransferase [Solirubrobacter sp.]
MEIARALLIVGEAGGGHPWPGAPPTPKPLFPIGNRPILFHQLESLSSAGVLEAVMVSERAASSAILDAVDDGQRWGLRVRHLEWAPSSGLSGALQVSRPALLDEPVLVQYGGSLLRERMYPHISAFAREQLDTLALRLPEPDQHLAPGYLLSPRAISILSHRAAGAGNPVAGVRARGGRVREQPVDACLPCHGNLEALLESNRRVLEDLRPAPLGATLHATTIQGAVDVHPTARVERSLLRGPLVIGAGARISDAYVGPYTSIGGGVVIEGSEIEHSIVLERAELRFVGTRLESSVIGRGARVARGFELPGAMRISVGNGAEVILR